MQSHHTPGTSAISVFQPFQTGKTHLTIMPRKVIIIFFLLLQPIWDAQILLLKPFLSLPARKQESNHWLQTVPEFLFSSRIILSQILQTKSYPGIGNLIAQKLIGVF